MYFALDKSSRAAVPRAACGKLELREGSLERFEATDDGAILLSPAGAAEFFAEERTWRELTGGV